MSDALVPDQSVVQSLCVPETGWIRDYVDTYNGKVEVPPEAFAGSAYTLLSSVIGWKSYLQWADGSEPLTLYTALIGASATAHKTTSLNIAERIAKDANNEYRRLCGILDDDDRRLVRVVSGGHMSQAKLLDLLGPETGDEAASWERPGQVPPGHLLVWDELKDLLTTERGNSFLGDTRQMLLRIYGGYQPGSQTRSNFVRGSKCAMALMGTVTLTTWKEQLGEEAVSGGLMGRLLAIPYGPPPHWVPLPKPINASRRQSLVDWLVELGKVPSNDWGPVTLTPDAEAYWVDWYTRHKNEIAHKEHADATAAQAHAALFGRYQATALKFAGVQAVSHWDPGTGTPRVLVSEQILQNACAYIDQVMAFSVPVATEALEDEEYRHMRRVVEYVTANGETSYAELQRKVRTRGIKADRFKRLLEHLHDQGQISIARDGEALVVQPSRLAVAG